MKLLVYADVHGSKRHLEHLRKLAEFKQDFKPNLTIDLGDWMDTTRLRRGAECEDLKASLGDDWACARENFDIIQPDVVIDGNHDIRIHKHSYDDTDRGELCRFLLNQCIEPYFAAKPNVRHLPYGVDEGIFEIQGWRFLHGFGGTRGKHAAYQLALHYGNAIQGDLHRFECSPADDYDRSVGYICPAMCDLDQMGYMKDKTGFFRQSNGWLYGIIHRNGTASWSLYNPEVN